MESQPQRYSVQKAFFEFSALFVVLTFSNDMSVTQVRINEKKTYLTRPLKRLNHYLPPPLPPTTPLHDLIISPNVKRLPINFPTNACSLMQSFFAKKVSPDLSVERRHYALSSYLSTFLKVSSPTFVVQTMTFQVKLTSHYF